MSDLRRLQEHPYEFDFLALLRRVERSIVRDPSRARDGGEAPRPRLGDTASRREEMVQVGAERYLLSLGQEPHLEFPASNLAQVEIDQLASDGEAGRRRLRLQSRFLGMLGPQGALPLGTTEEVLQQLSERNAAFARFLDLFNQRFLALFFRSWGDSRPIVHSDQPENDRFAAYVGSVMGIGSPAFDRASGVPEGIGLYAGLLGPTVKSASRLRRAIQGLFGVTAEIDEFVGTWLEFEESERSMLGGVNAGLGVDFVVGVASYSVQDKVRVRIHVSGMEQYGRFLPDGDDADALADLVLFYVGQELDWDMEIAVPTSAIAPTRLGDGARIGWTSWMAPNYPRGGHRCDARFHPVAQREQNRRKSETSRR